MIFTALDSTTGQVLYSGTTDDLDFADITGLRFITGVAHDGGWCDGSDVHHDVPASPGPHNEWNWGTKTWSDPRTLAEAKADQRALIEQARAASDAAGFAWSGDTFASDLASQVRINTAMLSAIVAQRDAATLSIDWPLIDGSFRALDQDDLVALGQALYAHLAAGLAAEKDAYDDITAATTIPDVVSVGWPP